eukprot:1189716-Prorocentrum_minimum.AAC.4
MVITSARFDDTSALTSVAARFRNQKTIMYASCVWRGEFTAASKGTISGGCGQDSAISPHKAGDIMDVEG